MYRIGYCEFSRQNPDRDVIYRPAGRTDWLFLLFLSPMEIFFPDRKEIAPAGSCLLYTPHTPQHYQAVGSFRNSYVHFWAGATRSQAVKSLRTGNGFPLFGELIV